MFLLVLSQACQQICFFKPRRSCRKSWQTTSISFLGSLLEFHEVAMYLGSLPKLFSRQPIIFGSLPRSKVNNFTVTSHDDFT
jgi:hypothetical protein